MSETPLETLDEKLDALIQRLQFLTRENAQLREEKIAWEIERGKLLEKNMEARQRVEAMIEHLKNFES